MNKTYVVHIEYDELTGDAILPLTDQMMTDAGWNLGDQIEWIDNSDGTWTMKKVEEKQWVLVECVSQFRQRYMVEVPKGEEVWALDTVTMNDAKEFSQEHLGEVIVSHRVVSEQEALELCDVDNHYCKDWTVEQKLDTFFTKDEDRVDL